MGLFKSLKKLGKSLLKGIKKVFSIPGKLLGKVVGKKWAKRLMMAAAVFTGGLALVSGVGGFLSGTGFFGRFVSAGEAFVKALVNPVGALKGGIQGAQAGQGVVGSAQGFASGAADAVNPGAVLAGGAGGSAPGTAGVPSGAGALNPGTAAPAPHAAALNPAAQAAGTAAQNLGTAAAPSGGIFSKLGGAAKDFVTSTGGGLVAAKALEGYSQGKLLEEDQRQRDEAAASFADPESQDRLQEIVDSAGLGAHRRRMDERVANVSRPRSRTFGPTISYDDPYGAPAGG